MDSLQLFEERRRYIRYQLHASGQIVLADGHTHTGIIRDISVGGAFLEVAGVDSSLTNHVVMAKIQAHVDASSVVIESECKIAHVTAEGVGLFFHHMDQKSKQVFLAIMHNIRLSLQQKE